MYQGVVVVNKEPGFTSFDVVAVCRRIFGQKAVGHTGTLDPMARGVLPVCLGRATKLSDLLLSSEKEYVCDLLLGETRDTDDSSGKLLSEADPEVLSALTEEKVREKLFSYLGDSLQVPPRYAAIKIDGKKLYQYAREGREVDVPGRPVSIYDLDILEMKLPRVHFRVRCSKGTYIRSLCRDVGRDLGVGGIMEGLLRESSGGFTLEEAYSLEELQGLKDSGRLEEVVLPMDLLLRDYPKRSIGPEGEKLLKNGNPLREEDLTEGDLEPGVMYRIYLQGKLFALYQYDGEKKMLRNIKMLQEM